MKHYVYFVEDTTTGEFYIGSRSCKCEIKEDTYVGSMATWKPNKSKLVKTIFDEYKTREEANNAERILIQLNIDKTVFPLNRNYHIPPLGFCMAGKKRSAESCAKQSASMTGKNTGPQSAEHKANNSIAHKGKKLGPPSAETNAKRSASMMGKNIGKKQC